MANISKHGVVTATGFANPNIIPNTSSSEAQYTYPETSYSDKYVKKTIIVPSGSQYTLSFYAKSTVNGDKIRAHYYSPNTTTHAVTSQGATSTYSDGHINFTLSTEWAYYWVTYTQSETTATKTVIFPRLVSGQGSGTISVKKVKFEEGSIPTPWVPASTDPLYVSDRSSMFEIDDICKIHKNGNIQSYEFIEF